MKIERLREHDRSVSYLISFTELEIISTIVPEVEKNLRDAFWESGSIADKILAVEIMARNIEEERKAGKSILIDEFNKMNEEQQRYIIKEFSIMPKIITKED